MRWNITLSEKDELLPFVTAWMHLEGMRLGQIIQAEKDKYRMVSLICKIWKTKQMNKQTKKQDQTYKHRELTVVSGGQ